MGSREVIRNIVDFRNRRGCTLLGISPMSREIVDAVIGYANLYKIPLMLIASRRQIDSLAFGGGYVHGWDTQTFARYVREKDQRNFVAICRDHGGPWQNDKEKGLSLTAAMESAKQSFKTDIEADFDIIHIDPSLDPTNSSSLNEILQRVYELYIFCQETGRSLHKEFLIEVGTEEQSGKINETGAFDYFTQEIITFCQEHGYPTPRFIVGQIGTLVKETENRGVIQEVPFDNKTIKAFVEICNRNKIWLKVHNADYLPDKVLIGFQKSGVHSINIGPQFGVCQTRKILDLCLENGLLDEAKAFMDLSLHSEKWRKWMISSSTIASPVIPSPMVPLDQSGNLKKGIIAGHYVFNRPEFKEIEARIKAKLSSRRISLEDEIKTEIKTLLRAITINLGYFGSDYNWRMEA